VTSDKIILKVETDEERIIKKIQPPKQQLSFRWA